MRSCSRFLCIHLEVFFIPDIVMLFQLCPLHSNWKKERAQYIRNFCNISYDKKITTNVCPKSLKASFRKHKCKTKEPRSRRISWICVLFVPNKRETILPWKVTIFISVCPWIIQTAYLLEIFSLSFGKSYHRQPGVSCFCDAWSA